jgi:hypothetical protein
LRIVAQFYTILPLLGVSREQARRREEARCCPASQRDPVCGQL